MSCRHFPDPSHQPPLPCISCYWDDRDARICAAIDRAVENYYRDERRDDHRAWIDLGGEA